MSLLVRLHYSPWSEKARWALDHHRIPYRMAEHAPILGEPLLRLRARKWTGTVTVPLFVDAGGDAVMGSIEIARHAEKLGSGPKLFPIDRTDDVVHWDARADRLISLARRLVVERIDRDNEIQRASLPPFVPDALRPLMAPVSVMGSRFIRWKHGVAGSADDTIAAMRRELDDLRGAIANHRRLLGEFSFADIAMAVALQAVKPVEHDAWPLADAIRRCWTTPELASDFADLLDWRDEIFREHRRR